MAERRWFAGKGREIRGVGIADEIPVEGKNAVLLLVDVEYIEEEADRYVVPIAYAKGAELDEIEAERPGALVCRIRIESGEGGIVDAFARPAFARALLMTIARKKEHAGEDGRVGGVTDRPAKEIRAGGDEALEPRVGRAEQSNTSVIYGERWILKLFRRLERGVNLDREVGRALTAAGFEHTPDVVGAIEYRRRRGETPGTLAVLQSFVENEGDAWAYTLDSLDRFFERALAARDEAGSLPAVPGDPVTAVTGAEPIEVPDDVHEMLGIYLDRARLLGVRTAELHRALSRVDGESFRPEGFTTLYQRSLYQSMRNLTGHTLRLLSQRRRSLPAEVREEAERVLSSRDALLDAFKRIRARKLDGGRIRTHGDYHLGQVLYTGKDFVVIDFEGEPARPLSERRLKRSPLRDVAGMLRSFHYAAYAAMTRLEERGAVEEEGEEALDPWARRWIEWVSALYLDGYFATMDDDGILPSDPADRRLLLDVYLLEKALYELRYEIENRPGWIGIPIEGIGQLVEP